MLSKIITHPGGAHKDDFLACSVLLTLAPVPIERAAPSDEDLEDASVAVVDIGHRHEAERLNFDHQPVSPRPPLRAARSSLVLTHLASTRTPRILRMARSERMALYCRGPGSRPQPGSVERKVLSKLKLPVDIKA